MVYLSIFWALYPWCINPLSIVSTHLPIVYRTPAYGTQTLYLCCIEPSANSILTHPMVYWTSCLYFEPSTHGVSNPSAYSIYGIPHLPIVHRTPAYGLLIPHPMVFWTLCLRYFDRLPIVYQTPCLWYFQLPYGFRVYLDAPTQDISNTMPMVY